VVGKGASAAALTPRVRHTIATATALTGDPRDGLALLDRVLDPEPEPERSACTVAAVVLANDDGAPQARIVCAGHPLPLLVRDGRAAERGSAGRMLGVHDQAAERPLEAIALEPGDALVLYTDGVTEAGGEDGRFGLERLVAALESAGAGAPAQRLVDAVRDAVAAFAAGPPGDDIVVLAIRRDG
jgi:serine phosphatase RsbU (regulator of sigma subunit)